SRSRAPNQERCRQRWKRRDRRQPSDESRKLHGSRRLHSSFLRRSTRRDLRGKQTARMRSKLFRSPLRSLAVVVAPCAAGSGSPPAASVPTSSTASAKFSASAASTQPPPVTAPLLLQKWTGPYGGVPPFGRFGVADLKPALEAGIVEKLADIDRIANDPS